MICFSSLHSLAYILNSTISWSVQPRLLKTFTSKERFSLFLSVKSTIIVVSLINWAGEVFLNVLQISPRLFVPCYVAFSENMRVIEGMLAYQGL